MYIRRVYCRPARLVFVGYVVVAERLVLVRDAFGPYVALEQLLEPVYEWR